MVEKRWLRSDLLNQGGTSCIVPTVPTNLFHSTSCLLSSLMSGTMSGRLFLIALLRCCKKLVFVKYVFCIKLHVFFFLVLLNEVLNLIENSSFRFVLRRFVLCSLHNYVVKVIKLHCLLFHFFHNFSMEHRIINVCIFYFLLQAISLL